MAGASGEGGVGGGQVEAKLPTDVRPEARTGAATQPRKVPPPHHLPLYYLLLYSLSIPTTPLTTTRFKMAMEKLQVDSQLKDLLKEV